MLVVPIKASSDCFHALKLFAKKIGVQTQLIMDPSGEQSLSK